MAFTKIVLTKSQVDLAFDVAKERTKKYGNDPWNDQIGALGEVAVAVWATREGVVPVDEAFRDPSRDSDADLYLGQPKLSIDVKSSCDGDAYVFPEKQVGGLTTKAAGVVWCGVYPIASGWAITGFEVLLLGWSSAQEVSNAPLVSRSGRGAYRVVPLPVKDLGALLAAAQFI